MEQLIQAFGIDLKLVVVQIINFVVLVALLSYFLYRPLMNILEAREERISQGVRDAEDAAKALNEAEQEKAAILAKAHSEAHDVNERAKKGADAKASEIVSAAEAKVSELITNAKARGEEIKSEAKRESEAEVAKMAVLAAEKVLTEKIG